MSIALIGISVIQFYWLKNGIDLSAKNFDDKVELALNRVKIKLEEEANTLENISKKFESNETSLFKHDNRKKIDKVLSTSLNDYRRSQYEQQIANVAWLINPQAALNTIKPPDLNRFLRTELKSNGVDLKYEYGVFSNDIDDYIITNGKYTVNMVTTNQKSEGATVDNLSRTMYQMALFDSEDREAVGTLRVFFPKKTSFLIQSVLPALISSIILTCLILFCFVYTINIILTQKKVSLMKTDFINNMTHEFKTPIATISLAADSINNPMVKSKPEMIERYADIIKQENKRMLTQVEKVLQIARLDKKDFELKVTTLNINDLVSKAMENSQLKVTKNGGTINAYLKSLNPNVKGDENHISNVIHNLVDNAIKYTKGAPEITLSTRDTGSGVEITVTDNGIGMAKDDIKRIFEKFYRVSTGNLHDVKGFGLGLSYVKVIVDAHKGKVSVESELGKGSTFKVLLPHDFNKTK